MAGNYPTWITDGTCVWSSPILGAEYRGDIDATQERLYTRIDNQGKRHFAVVEYGFGGAGAKPLSDDLHAIMWLVDNSRTRKSYQISPLQAICMIRDGIKITPAEDADVQSPATELVTDLIRAHDAVPTDIRDASIARLQREREAADAAMDGLCGEDFGRARRRRDEVYARVPDCYAHLSPATV